MKIIRNEFGHEYEKYRFGYCEYAELEPDDKTADFYEKGFLPYSADTSVHNMFYMARSARLALSSFEFSSENRRIKKRFDDTFSNRSLSVKEARDDSRIRKMFLNYFKLRHGKEIMPAERFDTILASSLPLRVIIYEKEKELVAVVLEVADETFGHFWFSAYDLSYAKQSLGMWLMLDAVRNAKAIGKKHYYIGTVYGEKALYKTNLGSLEFWNGSTWSTDLIHLKKLARTESRK